MTNQPQQHDLKARTVLFLTRDDGNERDRDAAKLLARCDVELRQASRDASAAPAADVLIHAQPDTISAIKSSPAAGRIENALREASGTRVRHLQWVEEGRTWGPKNESGIGDGGGARRGAERADTGKPPAYHHEIPDDLKRDKAHEQRPPGTVH